MWEQAKDNRQRRCVLVYGIVQGVGFRPFVDRIADRAGVAGDVCNKGSFVEIHIEGRDNELDEFIRLLREEAPDRSQILKITQKSEPCTGAEEFRILPSQKVEGNVFVSPDIAICDSCRREMYDPNDRRYLHPFINCTACGPRLTILDSMPYDRVRTSMGEFPMCDDCSAEYTSPETRRYHAQPVCCNDCGPRLYLLKSLDSDGNPVYGSAQELEGRPKRETDREAMLYARAVVRNGGILAIKGIGGFHLCCDARNEDAVRRLRELKQRPFKPFALMMRDMDTVERECELLPGQRKMMEGPQKPILLLRRRTKLDGAMVTPLAAPDNPYIGVMLPYAPVQLLLFDDPEDPIQEMTDCLVMTSANPKGAPICRTDEDILGSVGKWCDAVLSNNRKIRTRADDSVMNWDNGRPAMIRRSRGFAPLPLMLDGEASEGAEKDAGNSPAESASPHQVLGIGGELKNTFCLAKENLFYPSAYIGDLTDIRTVGALTETEERMERLLQIRPDLIVCDLHPKYRSSMTADELAEKRNIPVVRIQHHYAHVLSCMAENQQDGPVIGVSLDGTGYGTDHSVWGGEFLLADAEGYSRLGSLGRFSQAGGDLASRQGWRIAAALLLQADSERAMQLSLDLGLRSRAELSILHQMIGKGINTVPSTSMGRLFDAASAVLGFRTESTCEGEASMVLQFAAEKFLREHVAPGGGSGESAETTKSAPAAGNAGADALEENRILEKILDWKPELVFTESQDEPIGGERVPDASAKDNGLDTNAGGADPAAHADHSGSAERADGAGASGHGMFRIPAERLILELAERRLAGEDPERLAMGFHQCVADLILEGCRECRSESGVETVCLTGGVMQNLLLSRLTRERLTEDRFRVLTHSMIPANDGGIGLGQALYGMHLLKHAAE